MSEDDLFKRFAALKAPTSSLPDYNVEEPNVSGPSYKHHTEEAARKAKEEDDELEKIADGRFDGLNLGGKKADDVEDEDDELRKRIAKLRGNDGYSSGFSRQDQTEAVDEDKNIEAFLASFTTATPYDPHLDEDVSSNVLSQEAKSALEAAKLYIPPSGKDEEGLHGEVEDAEVEDEEIEEQILTRALEEASLDKLHDPSDDPPSHREGAAKNSNGEKKENGLSKLDELDGLDKLTFPSLPTHIPQSKEEEDDDEGIDEETQKRLNALLGLSPSPHKPGQGNDDNSGSIPKVIPKNWNLPGFDMNRDEEVDSWCCICNKDATIICSGCDDDLYCEECWKDGHGNGEAQERGHKAKRFVFKKQLIGAS